MGRVSRFKRIKSVDPFSKHKSVDEGDFDRAPKGDDSKLSKKMRLFVQAKEKTKMLERSKNKQRKDAFERKQQKKKQEEDMPAPMQGETLKQFGNRLDMEMSEKVANAAKANSRRKQKNREARMEKLKKKKEKQHERQMENEMFQSTQKRVKLHDVAQAPPTLSAAPRKVPQKSKGEKVKTLLLSQQDSDDESTSKPRSKQMLAPVRAIALEEERERVIQAYRNLKRKQPTA
eukprot:m.40826 g.40826  ORF g.40826 m.40826 type:complete len:232 (+) comp11936_c0_seq1:42-737(+)